MIENACAMADAGAAVAVATAPAYFAYIPDELETIFLGFADASPVPVIIYDMPQFVQAKLNFDLVKRLADHQNIIGLKDSSADVDGFKALLNLFQERRQFHLLQGKEHLLADSLSLGASGFVVSLIHLNPKPFIALKRAAKAGETAKAQEIQKQIAKVMEMSEAQFKARPAISNLYHVLNLVLQRRGLCANIVLEHEGECPPYLAKLVNELLSILNAV